MIYLIPLLILLQTATAEERLIIKFPKNVVPPDGTATRVFGGSTATDGQFPYMVFVLYNSGRSLSSCSASLVSPDKVLLAAHCFENNLNPNPNDVLAIAGKSDLGGYVSQRFKIPFSQDVDEKELGIQERRGNEVKIAPNFVKDTLLHDLAIFSVKKPFELTNNVRPIALAKDKLTTRTSCSIHGWGMAEGNTRSYRLVYAFNAHALPIQSCQYKRRGPFLCLESSRSGICQGDSGSPLVCNNEIVGVASHVLASRTGADCGDDMEEFYATVNQDLGWLQSLLDAPPIFEQPGDSNDNAGGSGVSLTASVLVLAAGVVSYHLC